MDYNVVIKERFSCRKFKDVLIEKKDLIEILEAGRIAPTAMNYQPFKIYVLESDEALEKLDSLTHCRYNAKIVLLFTYDINLDWKNPLEKGVHSGIEDVSIVATHIMLKARDLGIDSCWCNYFSTTKIEETFNLPENEKSVLIMPLGYKDDSCVISPMHDKKKELEEIVKYI